MKRLSSSLTHRGSSLGTGEVEYEYTLRFTSPLRPEVAKLSPEEREQFIGAVVGTVIIDLGERYAMDFNDELIDTAERSARADVREFGDALGLKRP